MSVALQMDAGQFCRPESSTHGVVAVFAYGFAHLAATCSCGWTGVRRYLRAGAQMDAWQHAMQQNCDVSVPLVIPVVGR